MHLDVGEVDFASHIHVPAMCVQSHLPFDDLPNFTGRAAAVSSQGSSVFGKSSCDSGLLSPGSCAPLTLSGLPPGRVESHFLDESQMQWSSADIDTEPFHARSPTKINEKCIPLEPPREFCVTMVRSFLLAWWTVGRHSADLGPGNFRGSTDV